MKYHATFSTIAISVFVVIFFFFISIATVFVLNFDSPAYLLSNHVLNKIASFEPYSISFANLDSDLKNGISLNDVSIKLNDIEFAKIGRVRFATSYFSLFKGYFTKRIPLEIALFDVDVNIPFSYKDFVKPSNSSGNDEKWKEKYSYTYKINMMNADINYQDQYILKNLIMNLALGSDLTIGNLQFNLENFNLKRKDFDIILSSLRFSFDNNKNYDISSSVSKLEFINETNKLVLNNLSFATLISEKERINHILSDINNSFEYNALYDLFINLELSLSSLSFANEHDNILLDNAKISCRDNILSLQIGKTNSKIKDFLIKAENISPKVNLKNSAIDFNLDNPSYLIFDYKSENLINLDSLSFVLQKSDEDYLLNINDCKLTNLNEYSKEHLSRISFNSNILFETFGDQHNIKGNLYLYPDFSFNFLKDLEIPFEFSIALDEENNIRMADVRAENLTTQSPDESFDIQFSYSDKLLFNITNHDNFDLIFDADENYNLLFETNNFALYPFREVIKTLFPDFESYIGEDFKITSYIKANYDSEIKKGDVFSVLTLSDIKFNQYDFSISTNANINIDDRLLSFSNTFLTTDWFRADFEGSFMSDRFAPQGVFRLSFPYLSEFIKINFNKEEDSSYTFVGTIPRFESGYLQGNISYLENMISSNIDLKAGGRNYPIQTTWDFENENITLDSPGLIINADYSDLLLNILIAIEDFRIGKTDDSLVNGEFKFNFDISKQIFDLSLLNFQIDKLKHFENEPNLFISLTGNNTSISLNRFDFISPYDSFLGKGYYDIDNRYAVLALGDGEEKIELAFSPFENYYTGIIDISNLNLRRFGIKEQILDAKLVGRGGRFEDFEFSGNFDISPTQRSTKPWNLSSSILVRNTLIKLYGISYQNNFLSLSDSGISYDAKEGELQLDSNLLLSFFDLEREYKIRGELHGNSLFGKYESLFEAGKGILNSYQEGSINLNLSIPYLYRDDEILLENKEIIVNKEVDKLTVGGNLLSADIDLNTKYGKLDLFGFDNVINLNLEGDLNLSDFNIDLSVNSFDIYYLNTFYPAPIFRFLPSSVLYGKLKIYGNLLETDFHVFGDVFGDEIGFELWWLNRQDFYGVHPKFHIWDNVLETEEMDVISIDRVTKEKRQHKGIMDYSMQNSFLDYYKVVLITDPDNRIFARVPFSESNIDFESWVDGTFYFEIDNLGKKHVGGDLTFSNGQFSYGLKELPFWWDPVENYIIDFNVTTGNNLSFIYPLSSSPILRANLKSDTKFSFKNDMFLQKMDVGGDILIQSGQIYYFQKSFFITEGDLNLNNMGNELNPKINLRARLRDFDRNNEKIDIYLVLNNSTFDSINPSFESSPLKSNAEILSILGNAVLPLDSASTTENTVASLLTNSVDLLTRLGVMDTQTGDLNESIRRALSLDMFSLNSRIIENFLIDSVNLGLNYRLRTSALSRYLNNTSIYIGKNLKDNFFLQAMIYFASVDSNTTDSAIFASDLAINTELSLEWSNPLGLVTFFTHPSNITIYDIIRSFGLSFTKRITF